MKMVTYKGPGTHYLVFIDSELNVHFMVANGDKVAISDELYDLLVAHDHVGEGKLQLHEPDKSRPIVRSKR